MVTHTVVGLAFDDEGEDPWKILFQRYIARVRQIVRLRLGAQLRESIASEELFEKTFMDAVKSLESFEKREEASLINWLARLAERQIIALADYQAPEKRVEPDETASENEERIVEECLHLLSEQYRELILLRNYAGASWETVAEETGLPNAAAARAMHARAMVELGKLIREKDAR